MESIYFPETKSDIFRIFELYNVPKNYYSKNIESISYSHNEHVDQKMVHIKYWSNAKTLHGTTYSKVYVIERGDEGEYNVESTSPESEFLYNL